MGPASNMISRKIDYSAMNIERKAFTDTNGIEREFLVYMPAALKDSSEKLPVVFAYHGASQTMRNMIENGLWYHIADKENILLVFPECTLRKSPDMLTGGYPYAWRPIWSSEMFEDMSSEEIYARDLLDLIVREYPVDESRFYITGHSMGCMMSNYLGSTALSQRITCISGSVTCAYAFSLAKVNPFKMFKYTLPLFIILVVFGALGVCLVYPPFG